MSLKTHSGIYIQLHVGLATDPTAQIFQGVGIATSILSITKGCAEWWVRSSGNVKNATLGQILQAFPFFLPHVLFRTSALAFTAAFLGYWTLIPLIFTVIVAWCSCFVSSLILPYDPYAGCSHVLTCFATVFAPIAIAARAPNDRAVMKRAIIIFTTFLMFCLSVIRLLPVVIPATSLVAYSGLRHLNFAKASGIITSSNQES